MLTIRYVRDTIRLRDEAPPRRVPWEGKTLEELAPGRWRAAHVNDLTCYRDRHSGYVPGDDSVVTFVEAPGGHVVANVALNYALDRALRSATGLRQISMREYATRAIIPVYGIVRGLEDLALRFAPGLPGLPGFGSGEGLGGDGSEQSPTYSFGRIQTSIGRGRPIPIVYGEHLVGGLVIGSWKKANNATGVETLFLTIVLSEGPIESFGGYTEDTDEIGRRDPEDPEAEPANPFPETFLVNDTPARRLTGSVAHVRLGNDEQEALPNELRWLVKGWDADTVLDYEGADGGRLIFEWETKMPVDSLDVNFEFPQGVWRLAGEEGHLAELSVHVEFELYRRDPVTGEWEDEPFWIESRDNPQPPNNPLDYVRWVFRRQTGFSHTHFLRSFLPGTRERVRLRVYRTREEWHRRSDRNSDLMRVTGVNEIAHVAVHYNNVAVLGLELRAEEQLRGGLPRLLIPVRGVKCQWYEEDGGSLVQTPPTWTRNPARIAEHHLLHRRYGFGDVFHAEDVDRATFDAWADRADEEVPLYTGSQDTEPRYRYDRVVDTITGGWEFLQSLAGTARAAILRSGNIVKVKYEGPRVPLQLFGEGNVVERSLALSYIGRQERANFIRTVYLDARRSYDQAEQIAQVRGVDRTVGNVRDLEIRASGVTSATQAKRFAEYHKRLIQHVGRRASWLSSIDSLAVEPGDVVLLSSRQFAWGLASGVIRGIEGGSVDIGETVRLLPGRTYRLVERRQSDDELLEEEFSVAEETETHLINAGAADEDRVGRLFALGETRVVSKQYVISSISRRDKTTAEIEAFEYAPEVYTDEAEPVEIIDHTPVFPEPPGPVENLAVVEEVFGSVPGTSVLTVRWDHPHEDSVSYNVRAWVLGVPVSFQTVNAPDALITVSAPLGAPVFIVVQAFSPEGGSLSVAESASITYNLRRDDATGVLAEFPDPVTGLALSGGPAEELTLSWDPSDGATGYEVRRGSFVGGLLVTDTTSTSIPVEIPATGELYYVRAYRTVNGNTWVSGGDAVAEALPEDFEAGGPSDVLEQRDEDFSEGSLSNVSRYPYALGRYMLLQSTPGLPCEYLSPVVDLAASEATEIHWSVRGVPFVWSSAAEFAGYQPDMTGAGALRPWHRRLQTTRAFVEVSEDGSSWSSEEVSAAEGYRIRTGRYFRLRVQFTLTNPQDGIVSRARLLQARHLYRRPST